MIELRLHRLLHSHPSTPLTPSNAASLSAYSHLLRSCKNLSSLRQIHARLFILGLTSNDSILTLLINSYSSFNKSLSALSVFNSSSTPNAILFNSIIRCYSRTNEPNKAIQLYNCMLKRGVDPDKYTFTFALKACAGARDAESGALVHDEIVRRGLERDVFIGTGLVDMYAKLGRTETARQVFESMPVSDVVSWNAMIAGYAQSGDVSAALGLFRRMHDVGIELNYVSLLNLFPAICALGERLLCGSLHGFIVRRGFLHSVLNGLIDMYSKCGEVDAARRIFDGMVGNRDDVSWATMISGYVYNGLFREALEIFDEVRKNGLRLNAVSVVSALSAAAEMGDLARGTYVHSYAVEKGIYFDVPTTTALMTMYAKCEEIGKAKMLFDGIQKKDTVVWSAMISALVQTEQPREALCLFRKMQMGGYLANRVTIVSVLPACGDLLDVKAGKSIHCYALRSGFDVDVTVGTALVSMYAQSRLFASAHTVFNALHHKEIATWNALINGYAQSGDASSALGMFQHLRSTGHQPDTGTMVGVLPACALLDAFDLGASVHGLVIKNGFESDLHVRNATIDMYVKCASIPSAEVLFSEAKLSKDVISWNTMIAGYMHNGNANEALSVFHEMRAESLKPNLVTLVSIIPAVAKLASLRDGLCLHSIVVTTGFEAHVPVGNSLIDMYAKCGQIDCARDFFNWMYYRDTVSWNVMLAGYGTHGLSDDCIALFTKMKDNNVKADSVSFIGALSACRHGGLIEEGKKIFESIGTELESEPRMEHYACMVDLLGRTGQLDEAWGLIQKMPISPDAGVWGALLGACRMHSNVKMGEIALENLARLEPDNPAQYVALSNIYAQAGRWADARNMRTTMSEIGMTKTPGCSWT